MNVLVSVATGDFVHHLSANSSSLRTWWPWHIYTWINQLPVGSPSHQDQPYAFKAYAMKWAFDNGYTTATWIDSAIHMEGSPDRYMRQLEQDGYYFQDNGFNCAQTCSDKMLHHYGVNRDQAEKLSEVVGGCWGLHVRNSDFVDELVRNSSLGLFSGSRDRDSSDSNDPRFLFCRHDQSLMSLMVHKRDWSVKRAGDSTTFFNYRMSKDQTKTEECFVLGR